MLSASSSSEMKAGSSNVEHSATSFAINLSETFVHNTRVTHWFTQREGYLFYRKLLVSRIAAWLIDYLL